MKILGLKPTLMSPLGYWGNHDPGACLLVDEEIKAIAEEERFTRNKRAEKTFPEHSIRFVLDDYGITLSDIDVIAVGRNPRRYYNQSRNRSGLPTSLRELYVTKQNVERSLAGYKNYHIREVKEKLDELFAEEVTGEFVTVSHHRAHAASAAYCSGFDDCVTITVDNRGEAESSVLWDAELNRTAEFSVDNSVGLFYLRGCQYLGYHYESDAGKIMGLAAYGEYDDEYASTFDRLIDVGEGQYDVTAVCRNGVDILEEHFGPRREPGEELTQRHENFAYHLQRKTEEIVQSLVKYHVGSTGIANVALAGGVAMNCKMNREIKNLDCVDELFVQPAANDSGICLGAAVEGYRQVTGNRPDVSLTHVYYGPRYTQTEIGEILDGCKLAYEHVDDICRRVAKLLADGHVGGWFQGRMEYGARALGNRSILADPRDADSVDKVNKTVKHREPWRPFAPSIRYEAREEYLVDGDEAPFMILLDGVKESKRDEIPAVTHTDGTTRPQTVREETNERYYRLIEEFERLTGTPVVLNTSFNVAGEPIVESPEQAIADFHRTGLDFLALGDYLLTK